MSYNVPKILAYAPHGAKGISWPGPVEWRSSARMPSRRELLLVEWDYCYFGYDSEILDRRLFQLAAEYAAREKPDLLLFSSSTRQMPSGKYDRPEECFHILCEAAVDGGLYALGNKLFSRDLIEGIDACFDATFLTRVFCAIKNMVALAQPWIALHSVPTPDDKDFFAFVEHFSGTRKKKGTAWN